jgi:ring-1,2-phenylacetyl-CoA epoxidase subunit PaaE
MKDQFNALTIAAVRRETADAMSFALRVPEAVREAYRFRPGQHLVVRGMLDAEEVRRTYSICSGPGDRDLWITVKRVDGGLFSGHAHSAFLAGGQIEASPPAGRFALPLNATSEKRTYLAIAAGSGITPVMAMIRHVLAAEPQSRFVLIYGNRSFDSIIFREALQDLKDSHLDRLTVCHVLSRDADADVPLLAGRIDGEKIRQLMPALVPLADIDHVFLCGPGSLIKDARDTLLALGLPREKIHFEYFRAGPEMAQRRVAAKPSASETPAKGAEVVLVIDGARHALRVEPGLHIVEAALAAGIRVPYSCKGGMCCTCRAKVVEGTLKMDRNFSLEPWEIEAGFILTCQAQPTSDRVVLDYDQM